MVFRNFGVLVEMVRIQFKSLLEYKANLYAVLFFDTIVTIVFGFFFFIFGEFVFEILGWVERDFIFYFILLLVAAKCKWFFSLMNFSQRLLLGELNLVLTKPVNSFFFECMRNMTGATVVTIPLAFICFLGCCFYFKVSWFLVLSSILVLMLGVIFEIIWVNFFESFAFFVKRNEFLVFLYFRLIFFNEKYTPKIMESVSKWSYLLSTSIYGYFVIEILNDRFDVFFNFLPWIFGVGVVVGFLTYFMWVIGLKRYEAYG